MRADGAGASQLLVAVGVLVREARVGVGVGARGQQQRARGVAQAQQLLLDALRDRLARLLLARVRLF